MKLFVVTESFTNNEVCPEDFEAYSGKFVAVCGTEEEACAVIKNRMTSIKSESSWSKFHCSKRAMEVSNEYADYSYSWKLLRESV